VSVSSSGAAPFVVVSAAKDLPAGGRWAWEMALRVQILRFAQNDM